MRDKDRIQKFCNMLKAGWSSVPDSRFTQLFLNVIAAYERDTGKNAFYAEDEEFFAFCKEYFSA